MIDRPNWSGFFSLRRLVTVALLTAAWCSLWGSVSAANVLSGVIVSSVASLAGSNVSGGVKLIPMLRLTWLVLVDLVVSTGVVVREVLTPTDYTDEAIIAVPISISSQPHLLFLYIAITVTPGTAVVAGDDSKSTIYLHVLHGDRRHDVVEHVELLVSLVSRAFPVSAAAPDSQTSSPTSRSTTR